MYSLRLKSPAKINLCLKVLNKRKDGYHQIKTVFERISLCDEIILRKRSDRKIKIVCNHPGVPRNSANLMYKAADLLRKDFNKDSGLDIRLNKRIPVASGLGGGSSNAASILLGLNRFWHLGLSKRELLGYAGKIGSDVPFFVSGNKFAIGTGRGDKIQNLPHLSPLWHILVVPRKKLSTKEIYSSLNLRLTKNRDDVNMLTCALKKNDLSKLEKYVSNDLEKVASKIFPKLLQIKEKLIELGIKIQSLSGSGPAIFGITDSREEAQRKAKSLRSKGWQVFVVRTY